jgi:hypothetical protein
VDVGHGTVLPGIAVSPGQPQPTYRVDVRASRVRDGHFTLLQKITYVDGHAYTDRLHLTESAGQFNWVS